MELVQELFMTIFAAIIFSFIVAKLISISMASDDVVNETVVEKVKLCSGLTVEGKTLISKNRVQFVEQVKKIDEFDCKLSAENELHDTSAADQFDVIVKEEILMASGSDNLVIGEKIIENVKRVDEIMELDSRDDQREKAKVVEVEDRVDFGNNEDDWEGIERSELEEVFVAAVNYVSNNNEDDGLGHEGSDVKMKLYGLHKVAMEGPCHEPQPMALKVSARAKWNAWQRLENMSPEVAMEQYISVVSDRVPGWMEANTTGYGKADASESGMSSGLDPNISKSGSEFG